MLPIDMEALIPLASTITYGFVKRVIDGLWGAEILKLY